MVWVICPVCDWEGYLTTKTVKGRRYWYVRHKPPWRKTWCYIGRQVPDWMKDLI